MRISDVIAARRAELAGYLHERKAYATGARLRCRPYGSSRWEDITPEIVAWVDRDITATTADIERLEASARPQ